MPRNEDELELREGDIVDVMEKCDDGWFVGKRREYVNFHLWKTREFVLNYLKNLKKSKTQIAYLCFLSCPFNYHMTPPSYLETG